MLQQRVIAPRKTPQSPRSDQAIAITTSSRSSQITISPIAIPTGPSPRAVQRHERAATIEPVVDAIAHTP